MGKIFKIKFLGMTALGLVVCAHMASAEDIYVNCGDDVSQCQAQAQNSAYYPSANNGGGYQVPGSTGIIPATPELNGRNDHEQIIIRDTAAPISVSKPLDELEEVRSEYSFYKTQNGGRVYERDVTHDIRDDGTIVQHSRTKETTVTPGYVEMPSISASQRGRRVQYGDSVHDWEALTGESLRSLLIEWGQKSGWTVAWKMDRDYILEAGVVFRGTFVDVASAILRIFARANPAPQGTFFKGNRVLVIQTQEDDNA